MLSHVQFTSSILVVNTDNLCVFLWAVTSSECTVSTASNKTSVLKFLSICIKNCCIPALKLQWYYVHTSLVEIEETGEPPCLKLCKLSAQLSPAATRKELWGAAAAARICASARPWRAMAGKRPRGRGDTETLCSSDTVKLMIPLHPLIFLFVCSPQKYTWLLPWLLPRLPHVAGFLFFSPPPPTFVSGATFFFFQRQGHKQRHKLH